ncbi:MAG: glycogen/starch synthase [Bacteroidia bacterium]|nr:glycogen/starch synthase [Bacteroidia bacterium]
MTEAKKVLFITQAIMPYVPETELSILGRRLPQTFQEHGTQVRVFMPKWGHVNERRNQLHEVIRLSGMNLIINDSDHPLLIKVASIQQARLQIYFIDNDDYFQNRLMTADAEGTAYSDNDERAIFYARGVLETVKKLRWCPDIIHCQGWVSSFVPMYVKKAYRDDLAFRNCKIVFSPNEEWYDTTFSGDLAVKASFKGVNPEVVHEVVGNPASFSDLYRLAIAYADGVVMSGVKESSPINDWVSSSGLPVLQDVNTDILFESYQNFYNSIL